MDQITESRLYDLPRSVVIVAAVLVLAGIYLVIVPVNWMVSRIRNRVS